jgi:putative oxygen-independent coproporphyrinogen III oxidase
VALSGAARDTEGVSAVAVPRLPAHPPAPGDEWVGRPFGVYVHVPYCVTRCGYCDFNTYTATELGSSPGASQESWHVAAVEEVRQAAAWFAAQGHEPPVARTVFFGGGTPTVLPPASLAAVLDAIRDEFGLAEDVEVTTEANPDSVDDASLLSLREAGFTRVSFGMQSAVEHVLAVLERTHTPGRAEQAVRQARDAGFEQVSLDLIYGTPGESAADWRCSMETALACEPDHISAYSLIVEDGTRLGRQVRQGMLAAPDDDCAADMYETAEETFSGAGLSWYEVSNWSTSPLTRCTHNMGYWHSDSWWGIGPGAHSHVAGLRWWNVKHPAAWAQRLASRASPMADHEVLDPATQWLERVMLQVRLADGLPVAEVATRGDVVDRLVQRSLLDLREDRLVLTMRGRLLADAVVRDLVH